MKSEVGNAGTADPAAQDSPFHKSCRLSRKSYEVEAHGVRAPCVRQDQLQDLVTLQGRPHLPSSAGLSPGWGTNADTGAQPRRKGEEKGAVVHQLGHNTQ